MKHHFRKHLTSAARLAVFCPLVTIGTHSVVHADPSAPPSGKPSSKPPGEPTENKVTPSSETSVKPAEKKPMVKKLANGNYQIGLITFNQKTREISIPARTEIVAPGSVLEYLLVHTNGEKVHEALLTSDADPTHLNIALKLLRYKESQELFRELKADGTPGDTYPAVPEETRKAARFSIHVTYKHQGKDKTVLVSDWIQHHATKKPMPKTAWVYNGSYIHDKKFKAKINGNMLSILTDLSAIANYSGDDREDDTIWFPAPRIPAGGTKVTVTLKPWKQ